MPNRNSVMLVVGVMLSMIVALIIGGAQAQQLIPLPPPPGERNVESVNLLTNASFENDSNDDNDQLPDGWHGDNTDTEAADKRRCNTATKQFAHTGNCAFQFKHNPDYNKSKLEQKLTAPLGIANGDILEFSVYIRQETFFGGPYPVGRAFIKYSDGSKQTLTLRSIKIDDDDDEGRGLADYYTQISVTETVVIPAGAVIQEVRVRFFTGGLSSFFIDDARLEIIQLGAPPTPVGTPIAAAAKIILNNGQAYDGFGSALAMNRDGTIALTGGAKIQNGPLTFFRLVNGAWTQKRQLFLPGANQFPYGSSTALSISNNSNTILVGFWNFYSDLSFVYILTKDGDNWLEQELVASDDKPGDFFGRVVALSGDEQTALVGAYGTEFNVPGAAYIFTRSGGVWTQQAKLSAGDGAQYAGFGDSVALSDNGNTAVIGAPQDNIGSGTGQGAAHVFTRSGGVWTLQQKLGASDGVSDDYFGGSVALSADGNTVLVGAAYHDDGPRINQGAAYVFTRSGGIWTQQQKLVAAYGGLQDRFGQAVALRDDGSAALIGAPADEINGNFSQGSAYFFTRSGTLWTERSNLTASDGQRSSQFGSAVAFSGLGQTAIIGAASDQINNNDNQGSAYIFTLP
ncbi:MAG: FG-GAP repeat protein [Armatimonadetes bacterium]|nr:FG-GAP repeat protein [Anaerolineae bacterium]